MSFENTSPSNDSNKKTKDPEKLKININLKEDKNTYSKESNDNQKNIEINFNTSLDIKKIKELNSNSVELIFEEKYEIALEILKKIELFLEVNIIESKYNFNKKILIIILHNLSCCYQKIKDYDNCIQYLDSVLYHFDRDLEKNHKIKIDETYFSKNLYNDLSNYSLLGDYILELRFSAKFHLQMCAALSQANKHVEALKHAKLAGLICEDNLIKTQYLFNQMKLKPNIFKNNNEDRNEIDNNINDKEKMNMTEIIINDIYNKIKNIKKRFYPNSKEKNISNFDSYLKYRKKEIRKNEKNNTLLNNIRNIFGNEVQKEDWIQLLNIGNIMYLSALNEEDLDLDSDPKYEILRDAILEKIVMFTISYFCISTEMNHLSKDKNDKKTNGEFFLYQAVLFSEKYLPVSCPLIKYYINSYYKYYEKDLEIIPEGKIKDYRIELIRNEIEKNKDSQSFVTIKKINYYNNENDNKINYNNIISNLNIKTDIINQYNNNKINMKGININNEKNGNEKGKIKIPFGLKFNLNFADIINNNLNDNQNETFNNKIVKGPHNTKITINNDSKNANNNGENYQLFFNKKNINIAEKSKIKQLPKFKLNFNKINNIDNNNEENKISLGKNCQSLSNKLSQKNNKKIKKINTKITMGNKTNRNAENGSKINKNNFNKKSGYKTDRPKSNQRPININDNDIIIINHKDQIRKDIKRNSFIIPFHSNKYFSKSSKYIKSPKSSNKNKTKGNLTDRMPINKSNNKSLKRNNEKLIKMINNMDNAGYKTHRDLTKKINLDINNSEKNAKYSTDNNQKERKNKSKNKNINNNINKKIIIVNNKNNNYINKNKINFNFKNHKKDNNNSKIKSNNINIIDILYKNLFNFGNKNNKIYKNVIGFNKNSANIRQINNIKSFPLNIINKNPFKI